MNESRPTSVWLSIGQPTPPASQPQAPAVAPLAEDLPCHHCTYNLRTRLPTDRCPECGTPVADSIVHFREGPPIQFKQLALGALLIACLPAIALLGHNIERASQPALEAMSPPPRVLFALTYCGPDMLMALLLIPAVALVAFSKSNGRRIAHGCCVGLAAVIPLLWTYDIVSFETGIITNMAVYWMFNAICEGLIFLLEFILAVAAWVFMKDFARRRRLWGLGILTHILLPLAALTLLALTFSPVIGIQWQDSVYYPSLIIGRSAIFVYWMIAAVIARTQHHG